LLKISERRVADSGTKSTFTLNALAISKLLREITLLLLKDNYSLTSLHVKALEKVCADGKPFLDQLLEGVETEEVNITNALFVDIGDAIAYLQDGLQHLQPIVKMMLFEDATRPAKLDTKEVKQTEESMPSPASPASPVAQEPVEKNGEKEKEKEALKEEEPKKEEQQQQQPSSSKPATHNQGKKETPQKSGQKASQKQDVKPSQKQQKQQQQQQPKQQEKSKQQQQPPKAEAKVEKKQEEVAEEEEEEEEDNFVEAREE
jgi:hypothetical protein